MNEKECPVCGGPMRRREHKQVDRIPGTKESNARAVSEWVCPECDYFEEVVEE
jgi:hypothetical protein